MCVQCSLLVSSFKELTDILLAYILPGLTGNS